MFGPVVLGIDPGKDGAVVAIDIRTMEVVAWWLTSDSFVTKGKGKRVYVDGFMAAAIDQLVEDCECVRLVVIEKQQARPGQGRTSMMSIGVGFGLWRGISAAHRFPTAVVHPKTWQKRVLRDVPGEGKARAIVQCQSRLPSLDLVPGRRRKQHDGLADAGCLALYGIGELPRMYEEPVE